jgi:hypothetical protein
MNPPRPVSSASRTAEKPRKRSYVMRRWPRRCTTRDLTVSSAERSATSCSALEAVHGLLYISAIPSLHLLQDCIVCIYIGLLRLLPSSLSLAGKAEHSFRRGLFDYRRFF